MKEQYKVAWMQNGMTFGWYVVHRNDPNDRQLYDSRKQARYFEYPKEKQRLERPKQ